MANTIDTLGLHPKNLLRKKKPTPVRTLIVKPTENKAYGGIARRFKEIQYK